MKTLLLILTVSMLVPVYADEKSSKEGVEKLWAEVLKEKKQYAAMEKDGASKKELALQKKLIEELYKEMITQKKALYGDKAEKKKDFEGNEAWQAMLKAKKEYAAMEKDGASKEELIEQKKKIMALYKEAKSEK